MSRSESQRSDVDSQAAATSQGSTDSQNSDTDGSQTYPTMGESSRSLRRHRDEIIELIRKQSFGDPKHMMAVLELVCRHPAISSLLPTATIGSIESTIVSNLRSSAAELHERKDRVSQQQLNRLIHHATANLVPTDRTAPSVALALGISNSKRVAQTIRAGADGRVEDLFTTQPRSDCLDFITDVRLVFFFF
jgi:hypothetical protein